MFTSTIAFLTKILPSEGILCGFILPEKRHIWAHNQEDLAKELLKLDSLNYTVYHACASFKEPTSRRKDNVKFLKSFWLDIDAGAGKPYGSLKEAIEACKSFCQRSGLPDPMYINSGSGLHIYWPLKDMIAPDLFSHGSSKLKYLCREFSFHADHVRTADPSSILRPIGTYNRKNPLNPKLVGWAGEVEDYNLSDLPFSSAPTSKKKSRWDDLISKSESPPYDLNMVADQCIQMRAFRDDKGVMPEPDWKACLGVMAFGKDGDKLSHEWSIGDEEIFPPGDTSKTRRM